MQQIFLPVVVYVRTKGNMHRGSEAAIESRTTLNYFGKMFLSDQR